MAVKKDLTDKQKIFVDYLFKMMHEGVQYGPELLTQAKTVAGYGETTHWTHVVESDAVKEAIYSGYKKHASVYGMEAFSKMLNVMRNPNSKTGRLELQAAQAVLDASAIPYKSSEQQIEAPNGIIVLPARKKVEINVEEDGET